MGDAVGQGEEGGQGDGYRHRQTCSHGYQQAEGQHRAGDAGFHQRYFHTGEADKAADQHAADEGRRQRPARCAILLRGPQANGEHRQQVIEAEHRVGQAGHDPGVAMPWVGEGQRWGAEQSDGVEGFAQIHEYLLEWGIRPP